MSKKSQKFWSGCWGIYSASVARREHLISQRPTAGLFLLEHTKKNSLAGKSVEAFPLILVKGLFFCRCSISLALQWVHPQAPLWVWLLWLWQLVFYRPGWLFLLCSLPCAQKIKCGAWGQVDNPPVGHEFAVFSSTLKSNWKINILLLKNVVPIIFSLRISA